ncbi:MAG: Ulp1 family isopeptidase, partial [Anaerolineae bacterium]
ASSLVTFNGKYYEVEIVLISKNRDKTSFQNCRLSDFERAGISPERIHEVVQDELEVLGEIFLFFPSLTLQSLSQRAVSFNSCCKRWDDKIEDEYSPETLQKVRDLIHEIGSVATRLQLGSKGQSEPDSLEVKVFKEEMIQNHIEKLDDFLTSQEAFNDLQRLVKECPGLAVPTHETYLTEKSTATYIVEEILFPANPLEDHVVYFTGCSLQDYAGVDLKCHKAIAIPVFNFNNHWSVLYIDFEERKVLHGDPKNYKHCEPIQENFKALAQELGRKVGGEAFLFKRIALATIDPHPIKFRTASEETIRKHKHRASEWLTTDTAFGFLQILAQKFPTLAVPFMGTPVAFNEKSTVSQILEQVFPEDPESEDALIFFTNRTQEDHAGVNPEHHKVVILPIHNAGNHWCLLYIDLERKRVIYGDAMGNYGSSEMFKRRYEAFARELGARLKTDPFLFESIIDPENSGGRLQQDGSSCGVWIEYFADNLLKNPDVDFSRLDRWESRNMILQYRWHVYEMLEQQ